MGVVGTKVGVIAPISARMKKLLGKMGVVNSQRGVVTQISAHVQKIARAHARFA